jgi:hypothetical protein
MTTGEIKNQVMFQTNNDAEDVGDFLPFLLRYINDGYDRLVYVYANKHLGDEAYPALQDDGDVPNVPEWTHHCLADYATWLVYRNGNPNKQQRGFRFLNDFESVLNQVRNEGGLKGANGSDLDHFRNLPY